MLQYKDGVHVLKEVRKNKKYSDLTIIMSSNLGNMTIIKECYLLGADWFIKFDETTPKKWVEEIEKFIPKKYLPK